MDLDMGNGPEGGDKDNSRSSSPQITTKSIERKLQRLVNDASLSLPHLKEEDVRMHFAWYVEFLALKEEKKIKLAEWRSERMRHQSSRQRTKLHAGDDASSFSQADLSHGILEDDEDSTTSYAKELKRVPYAVPYRMLYAVCRLPFHKGCYPYPLAGP